MAALSTSSPPLIAATCLPGTLRLRWGSLRWRGAPSSAPEGRADGADQPRLCRRNAFTERSLIAEIRPSTADHAHATLVVRLEHEEGEAIIICNELLACQRDESDGWQHFTLWRGAHIVLSVSTRRGELQYVRTSLLEEAGLRGGEYEPPSLG